MNLPSKVLSSFLALFLFVPAAFAEDAATPETDKPEIVKVKGARIWVPEGGFVEKGSGVYFNDVAAKDLLKTVNVALSENKRLTTELDKANEEAASRFPVQTAVIIGVVGLVVGGVAGGLAVLAADKKL